MTTQEHTPYEDDLAAYLLGALPPAEARALEGHLEGCERCRERERWLRSAADLLPSSVEQLQPPPELRERLMVTVREEAAEPAAASAPRRAPRPSWLERLGIGLRPATVGLAAVVVLAAGIAGFVIGSNGGEGGGAGTTTLEAQMGSGALLRTGDRGTLRVERLRPRPHGSYQVWIARAGSDPVSAGVFDVRHDGKGSAAIRHGLDDADEVLVTPEPRGGSPQPTANPVLRIRV